MISKRIYSRQQKMMFATIDAAEAIVNRLPVILSIGSFLAVIVFIQKGVNHHIKINCSESISVIVEHPTAVGPAYQCVSRAQLKGPAPALKP